MRRAKEQMSERAYILVRNLGAVRTALNAIRDVTVSDGRDYGLGAAERGEVLRILVDVQDRLFEMIETKEGEHV